MIGQTEIILIVCAVAAFLFGGPKIVEWAKSLGTAKAAFRHASDSYVPEVETKTEAKTEEVKKK